ncbi:hypothetical protein C5167_049247 [Papaver somniferum]|uniref:Uncharacterized protein n=1 Tax=Papaver somniferum TaxID=3469 RepID=A0A4Y7KNU5_PAPSO|nr:hypothetical protein C5167_049247 [Papaver somniferum]
MMMIIMIFRSLSLLLSFFSDYVSFSFSSILLGFNYSDFR